MIKAKRAVVKFDESGLITVDGYLLPSGELRAGLASTSIANGFEESWLSQVVRKKTKTLEVLCRYGFRPGTDNFVKVSVDREEISGASVAVTISLKDFLAVNTYAVTQSKEKAIAIFQGLATAPLENRFREALGLNLISAKQSLEIATLTTERVYEELQELQELVLPADELYYPELVAQLNGVGDDRPVYEIFGYGYN